MEGGSYHWSCHVRLSQLRELSYHVLLIPEPWAGGFPNGCQACSWSASCDAIRRDGLKQQHFQGPNAPPQSFQAKSHNTVLTVKDTTFSGPPIDTAGGVNLDQLITAANVACAFEDGGEQLRMVRARCGVEHERQRAMPGSCGMGP